MFENSGPDSAVGNAPERIFHTGERLTRALFGTNTYAEWEQSGEPAYGPGEVDVFEQELASVSFEIDPHTRVVGPSCDGARERSDQHFVDLDLVGLWHLGQEELGLVFIEPGSDRRAVADGVI